MLQVFGDFTTIFLVLNANLCDFKMLICLFCSTSFTIFFLSVILVCTFSVDFWVFNAFRPQLTIFVVGDVLEHQSDHCKVNMIFVQTFCFLPFIIYRGTFAAYGKFAWFFKANLVFFRTKLTIFFVGNCGIVLYQFLTNVYKWCFGHHTNTIHHYWTISYFHCWLVSVFRWWTYKHS